MKAEEPTLQISAHLSSLCALAFPESREEFFGSPGWWKEEYGKRWEVISIIDELSPTFDPLALKINVFF